MYPNPSRWPKIPSPYGIHRRDHETSILFDSLTVANFCWFRTSLALPVEIETYHGCWAVGRFKTSCSLSQFQPPYFSRNWTYVQNCPFRIVRMLAIQIGHLKISKSFSPSETSRRRGPSRRGRTGSEAHGHHCAPWSQATDRLGDKKQNLDDQFIWYKNLDHLMMKSSTWVCNNLDKYNFE